MDISKDADKPEMAIGKILLADNMSIASAESCTGGLICSMLTDVPGSSSYVAGGVISYSNKIKHDVLGVPQDILDTSGAVSEETALAMSNGVRKLMKTDIGVSSTGVAGPSPSEGKSVGLIYLSVSTANRNVVRRYMFSGSRTDIKHQAAQMAIRLVIETVGRRENDENKE